jgi:hypothetical protein
VLGMLVLVRRVCSRRRPPLLSFPLLWGGAYVLVWWLATPHEARHLLPVLVLCGVPSLGLLGRAPERSPIALPLAAGIAFSAILSVRALLFSPDPDLSIRPRSYAGVYQLPPELTKQIPSGAKVENCAGRPFNFALLGPQLEWRLRDYSPHEPSEADLRYHQVDFLVYRGGRAKLPALGSWRLLYAAPATGSSNWWSSAPDDVLALLGRAAP